MTDTRIIVFTCNWDAYNGLEDAGRQGLAYPPAVMAIRVPCLGRLYPGIILEAFERGADGVLLLGCGIENCRHQFGHRQAGEVIHTTGRLLNLLGYGDGAVKIQTVTNGNGQQWVEKVTAFINETDANRRSRRLSSLAGTVQ